MNKRQRKKQAKKYMRYLSAYATIFQAKIILSNIAAIASEYKLRKNGLIKDGGIIIGPGGIEIKKIITKGVNQ